MIPREGLPTSTDRFYRLARVRAGLDLLQPTGMYIHTLPICVDTKIDGKVFRSRPYASLVGKLFGVNSG